MVVGLIAMVDRGFRSCSIIIISSSTTITSTGKVRPMVAGGVCVCGG